jgi:hypothetical protein
MRLFCQIADESDIVDGWVRHYRSLGVSSFHLIVHGGRARNARLHVLATREPIVVEAEHARPFLETEKREDLQALVARHVGEWVVVVDADEFLEVPYGDLATTAARLDAVGADVLLAPLLQRVRADGTLDSPPRIEDPFAEFPLAVPDLIARLGSRACESKFPFLRVGTHTRLRGGNHTSPHGRASRSSHAQGVTHHMKWRQPLRERLRASLVGRNPWRHEPEAYERWLAEHGGRLPIDGAFAPTRHELFRRDLLRTARWGDRLRIAVRSWWRSARRRAAPNPAPDAG